MSGQVWSCRGIFRQNYSNAFSKGTWVGSPLEIDRGASDLGVQVTRNKRAIQSSSHRPKLPELLIAERDLLKDEKVARIQRESSLQAAR